MGSMYAAVLFIGITNSTSVQPVLYVERFVSYRERAAGMYSALPFAFAQVTPFLLNFLSLGVKELTLLPCFFSNFNKSFLQVAVEFPYVCVQSLMYCSIFYFMAAFEWNLWKFLWYVYFMYFTLMYFTFFGMMTTSLTPNHNVAAILGAPFFMLWNLFSGFMISHNVQSLHLKLCFSISL